MSTEAIENAVVTDEQWAEAIAHFQARRQQYQDLEFVPGGNTTLALRLTFDPLGQRLGNGERSRELYDEIMGIK